MIIYHRGFFVTGSIHRMGHTQNSHLSFDQRLGDFYLFFHCTLLHWLNTNLGGDFEKPITKTNLQRKFTQI